MNGKLRCSCGRWVARADENGDIFVWCKDCKKEVKVTPVRKKDPNNKGHPEVVTK